MKSKAVKRKEALERAIKFLAVHQARLKDAVDDEFVDAAQERYERAAAHIQHLRGMTQ